MGFDVFIDHTMKFSCNAPAQQYYQLSLHEGAETHLDKPKPLQTGVEKEMEHPSTAKCCRGDGRGCSDIVLKGLKENNVKIEGFCHWKLGSVTVTACMKWFKGL